MGYVFQNEHLMNGFNSGKYENKEEFRIIMNTITMNGAGKLLPVFLPICADWWMPLLPMLMASMNM